MELRQGWNSLAGEGSAMEEKPPGAGALLPKQEVQPIISIPRVGGGSQQVRAEFSDRAVTGNVEPGSFQILRL